MPTRNHLLRWGVGTPFVGEAQFASVDELLSVLDRATCESIGAGMPLRAGLYTSPTVIDPLLIQFTLGAVVDGVLVWHTDGESCAVNTDDLRAALITYLVIGERPMPLDWQLDPGD